MTSANKSQPKSKPETLHFQTRVFVLAQNAVSYRLLSCHSDPITSSKLIWHYLQLLLEHDFRRSTNWTRLVHRQAFKGCSRKYSTLRISQLRVINITANSTLPLIHSFVPPLLRPSFLSQINMLIREKREIYCALLNQCFELCYQLYPHLWVFLNL